MVKPSLLFSPHFGALFHSDQWQADIVGLKALGLSLLPQHWTPACAVLPIAVLRSAMESNYGIGNVLTQDILAPLLDRSPKRLIVRSSAIAEHIECRGWLESRTCEPTSEDIARAATEIVQCTDKLLRRGSAAPLDLAIIIQEFKTPFLCGHLANERRVSPQSRYWLCEIETPTRGAAPKISRMGVKRLPQVPARPLVCPDQDALEARLREVACWGMNQKERCHCEWVWDGQRLWIVQRDVELQEQGVRPSTSSVPALFSITSPKLSLFTDATRTCRNWKKAESLKVFAAAGLPKANLYALEDEKSLRALGEGRTPSHLKSDLQRLLESPIVMRTDILTEGEKPALLSPRSETLTSVEETVEWLKNNASEIISKGLRPGEFCFLAHRYIPARAGAFGLSKPDHPRVRIDSIWGFPDGLLCFPHDSFEVDTGRRGHIDRRVRCKPFYLGTDKRGSWVRLKCSAPWDWRQSLDDEELKEIARQTKRIAAHLKRPAEVMFFVGVDAKTDYPAILPWVHFLDVPDKPKESGDYYYAGRPFLVSNEVDLERLRDVIRQEREEGKVYIRLQPSPDLLRSKDFVNRVAATATELKVPVQLEGSILSHIYYMLARQNVRVRCTDAFLPTNKQKFGKLVRDLIPVNIGARGETARTITVPKEELAKLLKAKALEEAFELFWEEDSSKSFEEMADILEVIQSACKVYGRSFDDLAKLAEKKREERGGFEGGVVLIETEHVPLIGDEDTERSLFEEDAGQSAGASDAHGTATPKSKGIVRYKGPRKPRVRGRDVAVPLVPPSPEDAGHEHIIVLPDGEHELLLRYTQKELIVSVRKLPPPGPPSNQMELPLGLTTELPRQP